MAAKMLSGWEELHLMAQAPLIDQMQQSSGKPYAQALLLKFQPAVEIQATAEFCSKRILNVRIFLETMKMLVVRNRRKIGCSCKLWLSFLFVFL